MPAKQSHGARPRAPAAFVQHQQLLPIATVIQLQDGDLCIDHLARTTLASPAQGDPPSPGTMEHLQQGLRGEFVQRHQLLPVATTIQPQAAAFDVKYNKAQYAIKKKRKKKVV